MKALSELSTDIRQYLVVTANYWAFTLTDGALRMLVVLHFHQLGYSPIEIAMLFVFYEVFGVITNLTGGWLGAYLGLNKTMNLGLFLQIAALSMLLVPSSLLTVIWVMSAQALSGIAKDLNKMSAKSAIKLLVPEHAQGKLFKWVAILTGSKNALKGAGFFLGGFLLAVSGFKLAIAILATMLVFVFLSSIFLLKKDMGKASNKPKFREMFSKSYAINMLSAARLFLFGSRDVWFVVALPVYLSSEHDWNHTAVSSFLALWIIGYGLIQTVAPTITRRAQGHIPDGRDAALWVMFLGIITSAIAAMMASGLNPEVILVGGLIVFAVCFAVNSSLHSYLIVSLAKNDGVSMDVGFYYMANALGRLTGTVLSGWLYQSYGLNTCLWVSVAFIAISMFFASRLPRAKA